MSSLEYYALVALAGILGFGGMLAAIIYLAEKRGEDKRGIDDFKKELGVEQAREQALADRPRTDDDVLKRLRDAADRAD